MACPHHESLNQLAAVVLGLRECPLARENKCQPMACVDRLKLEELRPFFKQHLPTLFRSEKERDQSKVEDLESEIRANLGIWYATSFLTSLYAEDHLSPLEANMKALAREALQWHEDSFLTHVLVYFRSRQTELVQHYTTVLKGRSGTKKQFTKFLDSLQKYVSEHGTTVRGDAHLKRIIGEGSFPKPLSKAKIICEELEQFGFLRLPINRDLSGDEKQYGEILKQHFESEHPLKESRRYGQLHLAGGSDTEYLNEEVSIGAVAHMYIVFRGRVKNNHVFNHVMRTMLSRLAMSFSLAEISRKAEDLRKLADREFNRNERLLEHVKSLDKAIYFVEEASRGVRSMIKRNVWEYLKDWIIILADLFTTNKEMQICQTNITGSHNYWGKKHFAAALLFLVSATDKEEIKGAALDKKWKYYRINIYPEQAGENPIWRCLKRSGMLSDGVLDSLVREGRYTLWKDALSKVETNRNGGSIFLLLLAIGAKAGESTKELSRKFLMNNSLEFGLVSNGLNHLFEALLEHASRQKDDDENSLDGDIKIDRESEVSIDIEILEDDLKVCLSPVLLDGKKVPLISLEGFEKVCATVKELIKRETPITGQNDTSMSLIYALGVDPNNWNDNIRRVRTPSSTQSVEIHNAENKVVSRADFSEGKLILHYKLSREKGGKSK